MKEPGTNATALRPRCAKHQVFASGDIEEVLSGREGPEAAPRLMNAPVTEVVDPGRPVQGPCPRAFQHDSGSPGGIRNPPAPGA